MSKRKNKQPAEWVSTRALADEFGVPARSISRGLKAGRIPKEFVKREGNRWKVVKSAFAEHWFANADPSFLRNGLGKEPFLQVGAGGRKIKKAKRKPKKEASDDDGFHDDTFEGLADIFMESGLNDETLLLLRKRLGKMGAFNIRAAKDAADVVKREIEIAQMRGQLIDKNQAYAQLFDYGARVRNRLEAVPNRVVDDVLAAEDRVSAMKVLSDAIDEALLELATEPKLGADG